MVDSMDIGFGSTASGSTMPELLYSRYGMVLQSQTEDKMGNACLDVYVGKAMYRRHPV